MLINQRVKHYIESSKDDNDLVESLWWVQRWVSGSMTDEDWEEGWLTSITNVNQAFLFINKHIKHTPVTTLYRGLRLSKASAKQMQDGMIIKPAKSAFQSFSTDKSIAIEVTGYRESLPIPVVVTIESNPSLIMFSMQDLMKAGGTNSTIHEWLQSLSDWHYQNEVIVKITKPMPIIDFEIL